MFGNNNNSNQFVYRHYVVTSEALAAGNVSIS